MFAQLVGLRETWKEWGASGQQMKRPQMNTLQQPGDIFVRLVLCSARLRPKTLSGANAGKVFRPYVASLSDFGEGIERRYWYSGPRLCGFGRNSGHKCLCNPESLSRHACVCGCANPCASTCGCPRGCSLNLFEANCWGIAEAMCKHTYMHITVYR
eukprot:133698-Pelagomonas_calceolata.AAC.3